ncbi:MAG TPA: DUF4363 family protein [Clostridiaceae bacterium]|nr:DUF4363 family protein [Clostridiaceae bacterium]
MYKKLNAVITGIILIISITTLTCSCSLLSESLGRHTGFSESLKQLEENIRSEDWDKAETSLKDSKKAWKKLKPLLQIDIDHDFVYDMEKGLTELEAYIDTKQKPDSLSTVLLIKDIWQKIGTL